MGGLTKSACTPGLTKSVKVFMYALTIAYLVSPVYLKCEDVSLFSIFYFLFSFLWAHKKHKDANKQISDFFLLRCFLSALFIFVCYLRFCAFAWLRLYSFVLLARVKSFRKKKNKKFETSLMTPFTLLLGSMQKRTSIVFMISFYCLKAYKGEKSPNLSVLTL